MNLCIGIGYDIHRLAPGRRLVLGGIEIPFDKGLIGHSDGDVLLHAIADAILGCACKGDIGTHFPDTAAEWKDVDSKLILKRCMELANIKLLHVDTVVICEQPRLAPYIDKMRASIAKLLALAIDHVSVKVKTNERLGPIGEGKAIAAYAVVMGHLSDHA